MREGVGMSVCELNVLYEIVCLAIMLCISTYAHIMFMYVVGLVNKRHSSVLDSTRKFDLIFYTLTYIIHHLHFSSITYCIYKLTKHICTHTHTHMFASMYTCIHRCT